MSKLVRFGISLDQQLLKAFDKHIERKNYSNRSEAIRDLIRSELVDEEWSGNRETVGTITLVYDHHKPDLVSHLTDAQHQFGSLIISNTHVHLDHHHCLEVIIVKGKSVNVQTLSDTLISTKGVIHGKLTMTTTGKTLR
jgi:CopG family transcriptional regulator, nickel-responsive regulator